MRKGYIIGEFLNEDNRKVIAAAASECGLDVRFFRSDADADGHVSDGSFIYCQRPYLLHQMPDLEWCHTSNAGVDPFVRSGLFDDGRPVLTNSSGSYGLAISEHIVMVTLMLMRRMPEYLEIMRKGDWQDDLPVRSVYGSRVAVIGTGNIGKNAASRFRALGAREVIGFSRSGRETEEFDKVYRMSAFSDHIEGTDVLVLCVPGTSETEGLLNAELMGHIPQSAYVINVGRGTAIDQEELIRMLNDGRLAGAALDVMVPEPLPADHPLRSASNCILTPHISGDMGLKYTIDKTVEIFCENLRRYAEGRELINIVDIAAGY